ncbi:hypothetical protein PPACK8108_LOCUS22008 [Phakopsora pachyrhizi]|uniref:Uncharacterized protein n=1 Tax=Phakopsora pachyrhizi TaxID=170000 RepID=A0AAV0BMA6_PHAPC|nr:hypothetical protein PPACK8108_LOCUS22008 [Phakopsora pachyrhizi]
MALNLIETPQGRSPKRNKTRSASPKPQELKDKFISEFDPDDPALRISDLKDFISKVDPNIQLHNRARLEELQDTACAMINTRGCSSQRRSASPACSGLRSRSATPLSQSIKDFDPYSPNVHMADLSRSASPPLQSIKDFDPYSSGLQKADLQEAIFHIDPNCHIPSNMWLAELRDMAYSMIHPYARLPHSQKRSFETNCNRKLVFLGMVKASNNQSSQTGAASPACSGLRSRVDEHPVRRFLFVLFRSGWIDPLIFLLIIINLSILIFQLLLSVYNHLRRGNSYFQGWDDYLFLAIFVSFSVLKSPSQSLLPSKLLFLSCNSSEPKASNQSQYLNTPQPIDTTMNFSSLPPLVINLPLQIQSGDSHSASKSTRQNRHLFWLGLRQQSSSRRQIAKICKNNCSNEGRALNFKNSDGKDSPQSLIDFTKLALWP